MQVDIVYNHYLQDGNQSAVTGGVGTERLTVYGPSVQLTQNTRSGTFAMTLGSDIISSASTDNIDAIESSASRLDARSYGSFDYVHQFSKNNIEVSGGIAASIESDYYSESFQLGVGGQSKNKMIRWNVGFQYLDDDLRWGRLDSGSEPLQLIYPGELRNTEWHEGYKRYSSYVTLGVSQVLNQKNILAFSAKLGRQKGLLSTPFHRTFFTDGSRRVENLPDERNKITIGAQLNSFLSGTWVFRNAINVYGDSFDILAIWVQPEVIYKQNVRWHYLFNTRLYHQQGSTYFKPFGEHELSAFFYTSDFDLSEFSSLSIGGGFVHNFPSKGFDGYKKIALNYNIYLRNDGLKAHVISILLGL